MSRNYLKTYRQAFLICWFWLACGIFFCPVCAQVYEKGKSLLITDSAAYHAHKKDKKEQRQGYIEQMHRTAPDVDWKAMDLNVRVAKARSRFETARQQRTTKNKIEKIAWGKLKGTWHEIGSKNLAGRIHGAAYDEENDLIYLASAGGHIWKSTSAGNNWQVCNDLLRIPDIINLQLIPRSGLQRIVVASNKAEFGVLYSDDDGLTWGFANGLENVKEWGYIDKMVVANDVKHTIYVLVNEWDYQTWEGITSVYASYDLGQNFTIIQSFRHSEYGDANQFDIWTDTRGTGQVFLLENNRIRKLNKKNHFNVVSEIPLRQNGEDLRLTGSEKLGGSTFLYALYPKNDNTSDIYQSKNGGKNWSFKGTVAQHPFHENSFASSAKNRDHVFLGGVDCFRSSNGGATWKLVNYWWEYYGNVANKLHADICGINPFVTKNGQEIILISTDGGTYISKDKLLSVQNISLSGLNVSQYYSVYTNRHNPEVIYAGSQDQGLQRSTADKGGIRNFTQLISGDYGHIVSGDGGKSIWATYPGFVIYYPDASRTTHYKTWEFVGSDYLFLSPLMADPTSPQKVFLAQNSRMVHLDASGGSIQHKILPYNFGTISAMACSPINANYRYVLTNTGRFYWSSDGGQHWKQSTGFDGPDGHYFYGASILPSRQQLGKIYIAGSGYSNPPVFVSTNHGKKFAAMGKGMPGTLVYQLDATPDESLIFAATEVGPYVYITENGRWYSIDGTTAPDQVYWTVDYIPALQTVRFGTYGRGIFDFEILEENLTGTLLAKAQTNAGLPLADELQASVNHPEIAAKQAPAPPVSNEPVYQISLHPNPAREMVNLAFYSIETAQILVEIFDMSGHILYRYDGKGSIEHQVNTAAFHPGVYVVRAVTGDKISSKRLIIK